MGEPSMNAESVLEEIKQLYEQSGYELTKKKMKQTHPDLMRSALWYYPSWDHALEKATKLQ